MNVVLIGFRGSGKSTVGRVLAARLGWSFIDTDAVIEQRTGMTIRDIYADQAEDGFRTIESQVVAELPGLSQQVISTGGGAILRPQNVELLRQCGKVVYLTAPAEVLWERIFADARRHVTRLKLDPAVGLHQVREALALREPLYQQAADRVVDTHGRTVDEIVERILTRAGLRAARGRESRIEN